jgi:hypothetical protein
MNLKTNARRPHRKLRSVSHARFAQKRLYMNLNGGFGYSELAGDLLVGQALT